jgi:hypothetical protein
MYYRPTDHGLEERIRQRLEELRGRRQQAPDEQGKEVSE